MNRLARRVKEAVVRVFEGVANHYDGMYPMVAYVCYLFAFMHISIGIVAVSSPGLYSAGAYSWVTNIMPILAWGHVMVLNGILLVVAAWKRNTSLARLGLVIFSLIQTIFAASIFVLTFTGSAGAFAGSVQWLASPMIATLMLYRPLK